MSFFRRKNQAATEEFQSWMSDVPDSPPAVEAEVAAEAAKAKPSGSRTSEDHLAAAKAAIQAAKSRRESATTGS
jgi:hypothetical protein